MPKDRRHICFLDFETGGLNTETAEILAIGGVMIHRDNFRILDRFKSLMKPEDFDALEPGALAVNGLTKEQLAEAPESKVVWQEFCNWIKKYNSTKDCTDWGAPIPAGYNIVSFDMKFFDRYCKKFGFWDEKNNRQNVLCNRFTFDVYHHMWLYNRADANIKTSSLTGLLKYMGVPEEEIESGAHDALWDTEKTAEVGVRLLKLAKRLTKVNPDTGQKQLTIAGAFKKETVDG